MPLLIHWPWLHQLQWHITLLSLMVFCLMNENAVYTGLHQLQVFTISIKLSFRYFNYFILTGTITICKNALVSMSQRSTQQFMILSCCCFVLHKKSLLVTKLAVVAESAIFTYFLTPLTWLYMFWIRKLALYLILHTASINLLMKVKSISFLLNIFAKYFYLIALCSVKLKLYLYLL